VPEPLSTLGALGAKYGTTAIGLVLGTAAKYGLTLTEGKRLTWKGVAADLLLLGILGFIAIFIGDIAGRIFGMTVSGDVRVLTGSLAAVSSDRLVRLVREYFLKRTESELARGIKASPATSADVPAGIGEPSAVTIRPGLDDTATARAGRSLHDAYDPSTRQSVPDDMGQILAQLPDQAGAPTA
jgi:hypothetical protein